MERVTGIEPAPSAWKAEVLPLNYTRGHTTSMGSPRCRVRADCTERRTACANHRGGGGGVRGVDRCRASSGLRKINSSMFREIAALSGNASKHGGRPAPAAPGRVGQHRRSTIVIRGTMGSSAHVARGGSRRAHPVRAGAAANSAHPGAAGRGPPGRGGTIRPARDRAANKTLECHAEVTVVSYSPHRHSRGAVSPDNHCQVAFFGAEWLARILFAGRGYLERGR